MVSNWNLTYSKFPQVTRTLLSIYVVMKKDEMIDNIIIGCRKLSQKEDKTKKRRGGKGDLVGTVQDFQICLYY